MKKNLIVLISISFLLISGVKAQEIDSLKILSDKNAELYLRLATISFKEKDYEATIAYADSSLVREKSYKAYQIKGLGQFSLGLYKETILSMSQGIELEQGDFLLRYYRGLSYQIIDSVLYAPQISEDMLWAVTINPLDTMAYYYKGMANFNLSFLPEYDRKAKLEEAIADLGQFNRWQVNFNGYYYRGLASFMIGGEEKWYKKTVEYMTLGLAVRPEDKNCLYYRGISEFILENYEGAARDATELMGTPEKPEKSPKEKKRKRQ